MMTMTLSPHLFEGVKKLVLRARVDNDRADDQETPSAFDDDPFLVDI